jgi:ABC-2 type transport system permease protein
VTTVFRALRAEGHKLLTLPSVRLAVALGVLLPAGIAALNARSSPAGGVDAGFTELGVGGAIGAIVLGVVAVSSEYTAEGEESAATRQIAATLTATPARLVALAAKLTAVGLLVLAVAAAAGAATFAALHLVQGEPPAAVTAGRVVGVQVYLLCTAWLALAVTVLTRNGVVPMAVMIANASVVSVTYLLSRITDAVRYFPDVAGPHMFLRDVAAGAPFAPVTAGLVTVTWVTAVLAPAAVVFCRRDA